MYSVDRIENDLVILINCDSNEVIVKDKKMFPSNIKEGDIVKINNVNYIILNDETLKMKDEVKNKFNSLIE